MKRHVICLGDSNTHGYCGAQEGETLCGGRFSEAERWPCLLQRALGEEYLVIEEGLCGRTTVFEDPLRDGRKGTALFPTLLETHAQVDVITLMLGTNDCKTVFGASADVIGKGIIRLLDQVQEYAPKAKVLLMAPIYLGEKVWQEGYDQEFSRESVIVSRNLQPVYEKIAAERHISFLPAASYVHCCDADQEHLNAAGHKKFAEVVYRKVQELL